MSTITFREATDDDAEAITQLILSAFAAYKEGIDPPLSAHRETPETIRNVLLTNQALLAESQGKPIGTVFYTDMLDHMYLFRLAVLPEYQGKGIGSQLIAAVETHAQQIGVDRVLLKTRLGIPENVAFYQRRGYQITEYHAHPGYTQATYVTMTKLLVNPSEVTLEQS